MILDLIKSYAQDTTTVTAFSVGSFSLDCQLGEGHGSTLTTTDNPMESGALSSDHSYLNPKLYTVNGIVVSYQPMNIVADYFADDYDFAKSIPLPLGVSALIDQAEGFVNRYASKALSLVSKAKSAGRVLAPWLPDSLEWLGDESETSNRFEGIYTQLLSIQKSGEPLTVSSGLMTYQNMLLVDVMANTGTEDKVELSLTFKEVHIVETRTVKGLVVTVPTAAKPSATKVDGTKKSGRAADQAKKVASKGKTQVTQAPTSKKSALKSIGDLIRG